MPKEQTAVEFFPSFVFERARITKANEIRAVLTDPHAVIKANGNWPTVPHPAFGSVREAIEWCISKGRDTIALGYEGNCNLYSSSASLLALDDQTLERRATI